VILILFLILAFILTVYVRAMPLLFMGKLLVHARALLSCYRVLVSIILWLLWLTPPTRWRIGTPDHKDNFRVCAHMISRSRSTAQVLYCDSIYEYVIETKPAEKSSSADNNVIR